MQRSRIIGTGTYLPERVVTNDDLVKQFHVETSDAWIRERTGIGARRIAAPGEATSDMATAASRRALQMAGIPPQDLDTHIVRAGPPPQPLPGGGSRTPVSLEMIEKRQQFVKMNGREVFKTAVRVLEQCSREALERNGYRPQDVTHVIAHQANLRILDAIMRRLEIPLQKCHLNIEEVGNTSSASVPVTLDQANRKGALKDGDLILMMAIGGGLARGSALARWEGERALPASPGAELEGEVLAMAR